MTKYLGRGRGALLSNLLHDSNKEEQMLMTPKQFMQQSITQEHNKLTGTLYYKKNYIVLLSVSVSTREPSFQLH